MNTYTVSLPDFDASMIKSGNLYILDGVLVMGVTLRVAQDNSIKTEPRSFVVRLDTGELVAYKLPRDLSQVQELPQGTIVKLEIV